MHAAAVLLLATFDLTGWAAARGGSDDLAARAHLGADWRPAQWLELHASATQDGLIEAHASVRKELGLDDVQLRAGQFFLPTSRENRDDDWASPYTIGFSSLNAWIGEEVRPIGVDLQYRHVTSRGPVLSGGVTAFRGNDTMGTLLAWRGWPHGDRLTALGETRPLPSLDSLSDGGPFAKQRDAGTQPFGSDLDGRTGWSARVRYGPVQYAYVDNGGDRALHGDQYSWHTRFHLVSAEVGNPDRVVAAGEWMRGNTYMGLGTPFVAADFSSAYLLLSGKVRRNRLSARYELFSTTDLDRSAAEENAESGRGWTLTWLFDATPRLRAGAEFAQVAGHRGAADLTEHTVTFEARWRF
ncbi:MAG TPA: hypothetical protein VND45_04045 [Thermoanaerobaculia bacterium]|jgi:hypothetical protein|nr:hypothetical protein [Thermoanaerobaculia bacterium]